MIVLFQIQQNKVHMTSGYICIEQGGTYIYICMHIPGETVS